LRENFDRFNLAIHKDKEMADFRKWVPALALLVLLTGLIPEASAQIQTGAPFVCTSTAAVPPALRQEGLTELVGDIVLDCTGGTAVATGAGVPTANFTIFLNTNVTSRVVGSFSEAALTIDEPGSGLPGSAPTPIICTSPGACPVTVGSGTQFNTFPGQVSGNSVTFLGVPVNPPGTTGHRIFRITNVRANANLAPPGSPGQILALISASGSTSVPISPAQQLVGVVQNGVTFSLRNATDDDSLDSSGATFNQCESQTTVNFATLRFAEGFATAFKVRGDVPAQTTLGAIYNTESGLTISDGTNTISGVADYATRLKAVFTGVPNGVTIYVGLTNTLNVTGTTATLTSSETGGFFAVPSTTTVGSVPVWAVPIVNGTGTAVWEVTTASSLSVDNVDIPVFISFTANPGGNVPAPTPPVGTVAGGFAPTSPAFDLTAGASASSSLPIPRFALVPDTANLVNINVCRTNLLFPFVTNMVGFDTGVAISNTSTDPFGTTPQSGTCTLSFYGENKPADITTGVIDSNKVYTALASAVAPNFQGYIIAQCNFQYGHGFAFISDFGARNLAMGYLALVIDDRGNAGGSETLGH
jgi:hypothetical protein